MDREKKQMRARKRKKACSNFEQLYCNWAYTVISATKQGKVKEVFTKVTKAKVAEDLSFQMRFRR